MNMETLERPALLSPTPKAAGTCAARTEPSDRRLEDKQLWMMAGALAPTGGMPRSDDVARLMRRHHDRPVQVVADWIATRRVFSVTHGAETRLPLFQFERETMRPLQNLQPLLRELHAAFDDWEIAVWFASPHAGLPRRPPLDVFAHDLLAVLNAAIADRCIATLGAAVLKAEACE
jgi:hypothetical protein